MEPLVNYSDREQHVAAVLALHMHKFVHILPTLNHKYPDPPEGLSEIETWVWAMRQIAADSRVPMKSRLPFIEVLGEIDDV